MDVENLITAIKYELKEVDPYNTDSRGICPGCSQWSPQGHPERHEHSDFCPMVKKHEEWKNLRGRISSVIKKAEESL